MEHDRVALPSTSTVHAPHCPSPHPNFTACSPSELRRTYKSGCAGSHESTLTARPFTRKLYFGIVGFLLRWIRIISYDRPAADGVAYAEMTRYIGVNPRGRRLILT